jgi:YggT family protein
MVIRIIVNVINTLANLFVLVVIIDSVLSYFVNQYNPLRSTLDRIVSPFLTPIRRIVPPVGMFDLSPLILIILIEFLSSVLVRLLNVL